MQNLEERMGIILPSTSVDRKRVRDMIDEMVLCLQRIDDQREAKKDIVETVHEDFGLDKKLINKIATALHKRNISEVQAAHENLEYVYSSLYDNEDTD